MFLGEETNGRKNELDIDGAGMLPTRGVQESIA
jgi:hypothetical protein